MNREDWNSIQFSVLLQYMREFTLHPLYDESPMQSITVNWWLLHLSVPSLSVRLTIQQYECQSSAHWVPGGGVATKSSRESLKPSSSSCLFSSSAASILSSLPMSSNCSSHSMSSHSTGRPRLIAPTPHWQDFSVGLDVRILEPVGLGILRRGERIRWTGIRLNQLKCLSPREPSCVKPQLVAFSPGGWSCVVLAACQVRCRKPRSQRRSMVNSLGRDSSNEWPSTCRMTEIV
jgi:hypothetical protein